MILAGLLVNLGLGAIGRMVPSLPVFFLALPLQLLLALLVLELLAARRHGAVRRRASASGVGWLEPAG